MSKVDYRNSRMSKVDYRNKVLPKLSVHIYIIVTRKKNVFPKLCIPILPVSLDISMFMCLFYFFLFFFIFFI